MRAFFLGVHSRYSLLLAQCQRSRHHAARSMLSLNELLKESLKLPPPAPSVPLGSSTHVKARLAAAGRLAASQLALLTSPVATLAEDKRGEGDETRAEPQRLHPTVVLELLRHVLRADGGQELLQPFLASPLAHARSGEAFVQLMWRSLLDAKEPQLRRLVRENTMLVFTGFLRLSVHFPAPECRSHLERMCWEGMLEWERCLESNSNRPVSDATSAELRSVPTISDICGALEFLLRGLEQLTLSGAQREHHDHHHNPVFAAGSSLCTRLCVLLFHLQRHAHHQSSAVPLKTVPWTWFTPLPSSSESQGTRDPDGEQRLAEYRTFVLQKLLFPRDSHHHGFFSCGSVLRTSATADLLRAVLHAPRKDPAQGEFTLPLVLEGAPSAAKHFLLQLASVRRCEQTAVCLDVSFSFEEGDVGQDDLSLGCIAPFQCWLHLLMDATSGARYPTTSPLSPADAVGGTMTGSSHLAARTMQVSFVSLLNMTEGWVRVLKAMVTRGEPQHLLDHKPRIHQLLGAAQHQHTCLLTKSLFAAHFPGVQARDVERRVLKNLGDAKWLVRRVMTLKNEAFREDGVLGAVLTGGVSVALQQAGGDDQLLKQIGHRVLDPLLKQWYARFSDSSAPLRQVDEVRQMLVRCVGQGALTAEEHFTLRHPLQCSVAALAETWRCVAVKLLVLRDWESSDAHGAADVLDIVTDAAEIAVELLATEIDRACGDGVGDDGSRQRDGLLRVRRCISLAWRLLLLQHAAQCGERRDSQHVRDAVVRNFRKGVLSLAVDESGSDDSGLVLDESDGDDLRRRDWELRERLVDCALDPGLVRTQVAALHRRRCRARGSASVSVDDRGSRGGGVPTVVWDGGDSAEAFRGRSAAVVLPWSVRAFAFQPLRLYDEDRSSARALEVCEFELQQLHNNNTVPRTRQFDDDDESDDCATGTACVNQSQATTGVQHLITLTFVDELTMVLSVPWSNH